jgi:hypothetical protein
MGIGHGVYSKDGPFSDPVVRCAGCSTIQKTEDIRKLGMCTKCGHTRVSNLRQFSEEEWQLMKKWGIDPQFLALFADLDSGFTADTF